MKLLIKIICCISLLVLFLFYLPTSKQHIIIHNDKTITLNNHEYVIYNTCVFKPSKDEQTCFIGHEHVIKEIDAIKKSITSIDPPDLPNTMLLYGPPGTGKTTIAKQLSKSLQSPSKSFIILCVSMSRIENKYYGESLKLLQAVFSLATKLNECVLFFDEIDGFMSIRSSIEQTHINTLKTTFLMCLDSIIGMKSIFFIGATNRPHDLDPAFLRRMEIQMQLNSPTTHDRLILSQSHVKQIQEHDVEALFSQWTLHDINKFFRFVKRRQWLDKHKKSIDIEYVYDMYEIYNTYYCLNKFEKY
tara:strand:+ start:16941 stop:17846 length:906 start_codon:yes stop_codon:yes gene_type:complete